MFFNRFNLGLGVEVSFFLDHRYFAYRTLRLEAYLILQRKVDISRNRIAKLVHHLSPSHL